MLQAIVDKNAAQQRSAEHAAREAEAAVAERFTAISHELYQQSLAKASAVRQRTQRVEQGVLELERAAGAQAAEAEQWLGAYDRLCHGVQELGETEDWLHHMEAQMRSLSVELEHIHRQLEFAHDRKTPA